ncbi:MAG: FmdB family zinc ribbon protein [Acidimicrobiales bacterium]
MPTYEYRCKDCGEHLEVVQSFKDDPLTECPNCAGDLRKVFGNIGIAFKGSGFYKTDSRVSSSAVKSAESKSSDSKSSESKSSESKSSESKSSESSGGSSSAGSSSSGSSSPSPSTSAAKAS